MNRSTFWYKQAVCFSEWTIRGNDFGRKMSCLLLLNQLLDDKGVSTDTHTVDTHHVLSLFADTWEDKSFVKEVQEYFSANVYAILQPKLFMLLSSYSDVDNLQYDPHTLLSWCRGCGDTYLVGSTCLSDLERSRLHAHVDSIVPYMCKYLLVGDLDLHLTLEGLLHILHSRMYPK